MINAENIERKALRTLLQTAALVNESGKQANGGYVLQHDGTPVLLVNSNGINIFFKYWFPYCMATISAQVDWQPIWRSVYRLRAGGSTKMVKTGGAVDTPMSAYVIPWDMAIALCQDLKLQKTIKKIRRLQALLPPMVVGRPRDRSDEMEPVNEMENSGTVKIGNWVVDAIGVCYPYRDNRGRSGQPRSRVNNVHDPIPEYEIKRCELWLRLFCEPANKFFSRDSYGFKHTVEKWVRGCVERTIVAGEDNKKLDPYTRNGAFIVAALRLGYEMENSSEDGTPTLNGSFKIKPRGKIADLESGFHGNHDFEGVREIVKFPQYELNLDTMTATRLGAEVTRISKEQATALRQKNRLPKSFGSFGVVADKPPAWLRDLKLMKTPKLPDIWARFEDAKKNGYMITDYNDTSYGPNWFRECEERKMPYIRIKREREGYFVEVDNIGTDLVPAPGSKAMVSHWLAKPGDSVDGSILFFSRRLLLEDAIKCASALKALEYVRQERGGRLEESEDLRFPIQEIILDFLKVGASDLIGIRNMLTVVPYYGDGSEHIERAYKVIAEEAVASLVNGEKAYRDEHGFYHVAESKEQWREAFFKMMS